MAYFNQLQGYMSNLQEGINHENDVKQEYGDKLATTIEDKFNNISQQAEGWGGALTAAGTVWKHGRKVYRTLQSQGQAATDAATTTAETTGGDVAAAAQTAAGNIADAAGAQAAGGRISVATGRSVIAGQQTSTTSVNMGNAINQARATGQVAGQTGGSAAGGAPAAPITGQAAQTNIAAQTQTAAPTANPTAGGNAGGRAVTDADAVVNDTDTLTQTVSNIGSKVMGGMDAALDGIPVIGEIIGIGSLIGGLIHGLDKKNEEAKASSATQQGGTVGGGIDTSVFKGNTLGSGGGGYTV